MLLRHIYLTLDQLSYPDELSTPFSFRTRYMCNYLEKALKPLKFHAEGFGRINVIAQTHPKEECPVVPVDIVCPEVSLDVKRYERSSEAERHQIFESMLLEGLEKCARHQAIPLAELKAALRKFREGDCQNEWAGLKKRIKAPTGTLVVTQLCALGQERFTLALRVEAEGEVVFEKQVLETKPDEIIFDYRIKDVAIKGSNLVVLSKFGDVTAKVPLSSLTGGSAQPKAAKPPAKKAARKAR